MIILPAIDIKDGNCVRLFKGDYASLLMPILLQMLQKPRDFLLRSAEESVI